MRVKSSLHRAHYTAHSKSIWRRIASSLLKIRRIYLGIASSSIHLISDTFLVPTCIHRINSLSLFFFLHADRFNKEWLRGITECNLRMRKVIEKYSYWVSNVNATGRRGRARISNFESNVDQVWCNVIDLWKLNANHIMWSHMSLKFAVFMRKLSSCRLESWKRSEYWRPTIMIISSEKTTSQMRSGLQGINENIHFISLTCVDSPTSWRCCKLFTN